MGTSPEFVSYLCEQLEGAGAVRPRTAGRRCGRTLFC